MGAFGSRLYISMGVESWGREHFGGSVGIGAIFLRIYFQKTSIHFMTHMIYFFTLAWKHGMGNDYVFRSLSSDLIFL